MSNQGELLLWECNPVYRCSFVEKPGLFRALCENALRFAGELNLESRMSMFDVNGSYILHTSKCKEELFINGKTTERDKNSDEMFLNFLVHSFEKLVEQLDEIDRPHVHFLKEFLECCTDLDKMIRDDLSEISSVDNNPGTTHNTWTSTVSLVTDTVTEEEEEDTENLGGNEEICDNVSESSDIVQWKKDLYMSAFDETDFHIIIYNDEDPEVSEWWSF